MKSLIFLCSVLIAPNTVFAASEQDDAAASCAEALTSGSSNIYLQASLSKAALSDRQDRIKSTELPGREGNVQRYLKKQTRKLSPHSKELADRIGFFIRAGRLYFPSTKQNLSDQEISDLLAQTEQFIEESPSALFDVPTSASIEAKVADEIESHRRMQEIASGFAERSSDGGKKAREMLAQAESRHKAYIAKLRNSTPPKIADLTNLVDKNDQKIIFDSLRRIFAQNHPIFGDVRTDSAYPRSSHQQQADARRLFWKQMGVEEEADDEPTTLEGLRERLNPAPAYLETKADELELSKLREGYVHLIHSLPTFEGVTYWGADQSGDIVSNLVPGSIFEIKPFYNDVNVFAGTPYYNKAAAHLLEKTHWPHLVLYKINGRYGRITDGVFETSRFPEVVFLPGTQFRVDSHEFFEGVHYVEITEVTKTIANQPKEQELKVLLGRQVQNGKRPSTIRDLAARTWRVWYDTEPGFQRSFSAYAWRTIFADLGVSSVEAFRISIDDKTTVYLEEVLDLPHLQSVPPRASKQWLIPSYLALTSVLLGDHDIYANKISVYDRGGGRWVANNFWDRGSLLDSLNAVETAPLDAIAKDAFWKSFFKNQETAFFLGEQINLVDPRWSQAIGTQLRSVAPKDGALVEQYLRAIKAKLDQAEYFIRHNYFYRRTEERGHSAIMPLL